MKKTILTTLHATTRKLLSTGLALALTVPCAAFAAQKTFATPEAAVEALAGALKANDDAALLSLFGEKYANIIGTGDRAHDTAVRAQAVDALAAYKLLVEKGADRRVLLMGARAWPMPIPIVRQGGDWRFATEEGAEEIINRRIGRNERNAIEVLSAYLDAQRQYASQDRNGDGVLQYSLRLASTPGKQDGLYWKANAGEQASPFGPLVAESAAYLAGHKDGEPYRGYLFRILTRQGKNAAGGAYNYVINGRMVAGYAMVACPAEYGESGVMTFTVNHNGKIFEKNLGRSTQSLCAKMAAFDPGPGWKEVSR